MPVDRERIGRDLEASVDQAHDVGAGHPGAVAGHRCHQGVLERYLGSVNLSRARDEARRGGRVESGVARHHCRRAGRGGSRRDRGRRGWSMIQQHPEAGTRPRGAGTKPPRWSTSTAAGRAPETRRGTPRRGEGHTTAWLDQARGGAHGARCKHMPCAQRTCSGDNGCPYDSQCGGWSGERQRGHMPWEKAGERGRFVAGRRGRWGRGLFR